MFVSLAPNRSNASHLVAACGISSILFSPPYFTRTSRMSSIFIDDLAALGNAQDQALAADRPVVLEVKADPNLAPLPPHVAMDQAKAFMSSMAKGDLGAMQVVLDTAAHIVGGLRERL